MTQQANDREEQRTRSFNPNEHLLKLKSKDGLKDYLPVQWRLVWFREQCPGGTIDTEEIEVDLDREITIEVSTWNNETRRSEKVQKMAKGYARYKAIAATGHGGRATGHGSESAVDFGDFVEKAETKAIGRALAALGYGTQFTGDEFEEGERIVDAPVDQRHNQPSQERQPAVSDTQSAAQITEQQAASMRKLCQHLGKPEPEKLEAMSYLDAKKQIEQLSHEYNERRAQSRKTA